MPGLDFLTPAPPQATLQLESSPQGAEARTSAGPSCRTPCSVSVPIAPMTVTFTLDKFDPQTIPVQTTQSPAPIIDVTNQSVLELDPNPVFAQLVPSPPVKRTPKRPPPKRVAKRAAPPPPAPAAEAPAQDSSPFPAPTASSPFPSR